MATVGNGNKYNAGDSNGGGHRQNQLDKGGNRDGGGYKQSGRRRNGGGDVEGDGDGKFNGDSNKRTPKTVHQ